MNFDNQRLREIQTEKQAYYKLSDESESIHDMLHFHKQIKSLEKEEREILKRCDAI